MLPRIVKNSMRQHHTELSGKVGMRHPPGRYAEREDKAAKNTDPDNDEETDAKYGTETNKK